MSFFTLSDGTNAASVGTEYEIGGGEPIPDNTKLLAIIDEAGWKDYEGKFYVQLRWSVLQPAEFKGRKVFQKLHVLADDKNKADKAKRMFAAVDANAGGRLTASGVEPTDQDLTASLVNKPMVICVKVWELKDSGAKGNWVCSVSARKAQGAPVAAPPVAPPVPVQGHGFDDDVPF